MNPMQFSKLPVYAQEEISHLRMRLEESERAFRETFRTPPRDEHGLVAETPGTVILNPYSEHAVALDPESMIRFRLADGGRFDVTMRRGQFWTASGLTISEYGTDGLLVLPVAGNVVSIIGARRNR